MEVIVGLVVIYLAWGFGVFIWSEATKTRPATPPRRKIAPTPEYKPVTNDERAEIAVKLYRERKARIEKSELDGLEKESLLLEAEMEYAAALRATLR